MLSAELLNFQKKLNKIIKYSAIEAATEAFKETVDPIEGSNKANNEFKNHIDKSAKRFGKKFGEKFADEVSNDLAKAIMEYIQSAGVVINCLPNAIALTGPTGPVTGTIMINDTTSNISII